MARTSEAKAQGIGDLAAREGFQIGDLRLKI